MQIIVVGGSASKVGKTTLACHFIAEAAKRGSVVGLKVSAHERRRRHEITTFTRAPRHVAFHDTDRYLVAGAHVALWLEAGTDDFRDHLAIALRRVRKFHSDTLVIESTSAGAELVSPHASWFVAGTSPWKPRAIRHFVRATGIVQTHELAAFALLSRLPLPSVVGPGTALHTVEA